ncbi:aminotransferase class IV [Lacimicrobium alkaliphilum]|uniref:Cytochrome c550 n=1 Tax=Lacimicrobium alkaliphilum TaxID=1526571 RepID=A0ABQ1RFU8_9ALTE|nr:aminotransferase class IV [Lacimicrobium alkaliphilum]GGD68847.1 cytochrome c550 [Lacimicrobium alkaliphilum]
MSIVYLNGQFMPKQQASISPMDRGFLFADGVYEVVPSYGGKMVGFKQHLQRLNDGLEALEITLDMSLSQWQAVFEKLLDENGNGNLGIYLHISRGSEENRAHRYPQRLTPTVFAFTFEIPAEPIAEPDKAHTYKVVSEQDKRWKRCNIKSTALLGNIMHYRSGQKASVDEVLLFNERNELTEAAACNVFIVKDGIIVTPQLDNQILPGITRYILLHALEQQDELPVQVRAVSMDEVREADEIWLTSSSKELAPVVELDGQAVGNGMPGPVWQKAQSLFSRVKYQY